ncbi:MAG TPA: hypothetical protein VGE52_03410 [Pirellulales bacterium]
MPRSPVTWEQTAAGWRNLPPAARTAILVAAALAVGASTFFLVDAPVAEGDYLFDGRQLAMAQRSAMQAAWAKHGLSGYEMEAGRVRVPAGEAPKYIAALAESDALPADYGAELQTLYSDLNPFLSTGARAETLRIAKQNFLAKIIGEMPDVEDAWVVVDSKATGGLRRDEKTTASATVRGRDGAPLAPARLTQIQRLVASAIAGLDPRNVAVIDLASPDSAGLAPSLSSGDDEYLSRLQGYQTYYRGLVREALTFVPGATAVVNVELDRRLHEVHERQTFDSPPPDAEDGTAAIWSNVGRVALATLDGPRSGEVSRDFDRPAGAPHYQERRRVEEAGLTPSRVSVAVAVPEDYFNGLWRYRLSAAGEPDRAPTPDERAALEASETEKIRRAVATVLPNVTTEEQARALVTVQPFARGEHERVGAEKSSSVAPAAPAAAMWPLDARLIGAVSAAVLVFLLASSLVRTAPTETPAEEAEEESVSAPKGEPLRGPHTPPRSTETEGVEDHLRRRVDEDPEAALGVLRDWLHRGDGRSRRGT